MEEMADLTNCAAYEAFATQLPGAKAVLFFKEQDDKSELMKNVFNSLKREVSDVRFGFVNTTAKSRCQLESLGVSFVPCVNLFWTEKRICSLVGADAPTAFRAVRALSTAKDMQSAVHLVGEVVPQGETEEELQARLRNLVSRHEVMIFMKGEREAPFCRFSKALMQLLKDQGVVEFDTFDVFTDNSVREGMKRFSDWPTFPQVYVRGKFIGGLDILTEMVRNGTFKDAFPPSAFGA